MTRSQHSKRPLHAFVAWLVALLQLVGALHFALVQHTFSAALGGVVHLHGESLARRATPVGHTQSKPVAALESETPSCSADRCPTADVPSSSLLYAASLATGWIAYGHARLLGERAAELGQARCVFLSAPKTSPPV